MRSPTVLAVGVQATSAAALYLVCVALLNEHPGAHVACGIALRDIARSSVFYFRATRPNPDWRWNGRSWNRSRAATHCPVIIHIHACSL